MKYNLNTITNSKDITNAITKTMVNNGYKIWIILTALLLLLSPFIWYYLDTFKLLDSILKLK